MITPETCGNMFVLGEKVTVIGTPQELNDFNILDSPILTGKTGRVTYCSGPESLHRKNDRQGIGREAPSYQVHIVGVPTDWFYHEDLIRKSDQQMYIQFSENRV
jgi:hypothetical protein